MTSANRLQVSIVREVTPGTTPVTPRMRKVRLTKESLQFAPEYVDSEELRDDRMLGDPIKTMQASSGGIDGELSYPVDLSPLSEFIMSAFEAAWSNTPQRDNDGTADSVITAVATTNTEVTHLTGGAFVAGHLVRFTGFGVANNNGVFKCTTGGATSSRYVGSGITDEAAPAAAARMKAVGLAGASGDITALADGIGSTVLDFTTFPELAVGKWLKIGGSAAGTQFAAFIALGTAFRAAAYGRITAIAANKVTLDNLPAGWTTDSGTGKTIWVFFGDQIKNGVTPNSLTIERGFLGQTVPTYIANTGMQANTFSIDASSRNKINWSVSFTGMGGTIGTTALDASPDAVTTGIVMAANANVGRLGVNGAQLGSPNWAKSFTLQIDNNLRTLDSVDSDAPVGINDGECKVTGKLDQYFGSKAEVEAFYNGTPRGINARFGKNGQTLIWQVPRAIYRGGGNPQATGKNTDVMASFDYQASQDTLTNAHVLLDRFEYVE